MPFADTNGMRRFADDRMQKLGVLETDHLFCDVYCLEPGQSQKPHTHDDATKVYTVLDGSGTFLSGDEEQTLSPGGVTWAPAGVPHGIRADTGSRLVVLAVMSPNPNRKG